MDLKRLKSAYDHLQNLDDRLTHRVRPGGGGLTRPSVDQLEAKMKDLANFTVELKEILEEVILAVATKAKAAEEGARNVPPGVRQPPGPPG